MGGSGLVFSFLTGLVIVYLFRNYEFHEGNLLKRRYNFLLILQLIIRFILVIVSQLKLTTNGLVKQIFAQSLGISFVYDLFVNKPFKNEDISRFYTYALAFFEVLIL